VETLSPAVANQAAGRHELANLVDRRHQMADRLCRFGVAIEECVGAYWERATPLLEECGDFRFGARVPLSYKPAEPREVDSPSITQPAYTGVFL
jgi:hypothetical protein